jgi:hypothetical protein
MSRLWQNNKLIWNTTLFSFLIDKEDYWVTNGLVFKVNNTSTYKDAYLEVKEKLESPETISYLIEKACLDSDLFEYDKTYSFIGTEWKYSLNFIFENSEGDRVEHSMKADFVTII